MTKRVTAAGKWALLAALTWLTGCAGFFDTPATTTTSSSGSTSGDYVYVVNQATDTLTGFAVGSGVLTATSTYTLASGLTPNAVAVSIPNTFVYVAGLGSIECLAIGSGGVLTACTGGNITTVADFVSLDVSPDGKWLVAIDNNLLTPTLYVFSINTATGALSETTTLAYNVAANSGTVTPRQIRISPNGGFLVVALGAGGDAIFTFNTTTGAPTEAATLPLATASDNAVAFDATSSYVFVARGPATSSSSGLGVVSFSLANTGALTQVGSVAASGNSPYGLLLDSTGGFLYAANRGDGSISGYSLANGVLTGLAGSPYASGLATTALVRDNSGKYVVAVSPGGTADVTLYSIGSTLASGVATLTGNLNVAATAASGTDPSGSVAVAATH